MLVKIVENKNHPMTDDFKRWIKNHSNDVFKVKQQCVGYDGNPSYILFKVPFRVSKHFTIEIQPN